MKKIRSKKDLIKCLTKIVPTYFFARFNNYNIITFDGKHFCVSIAESSN